MGAVDNGYDSHKICHDRLYHCKDMEDAILADCQRDWLECMNTVNKAAKMKDQEREVVKDTFA